MENIEDLYIFAKRYGVDMKSALIEAGLGPNFAHRWLKKWRENRAHPSPDRLRALRDTLIRMAKESGTYKPGSISDEVAGIREALDRIESAAGGRHE